MVLTTTPSEKITQHFLILKYHTNSIQKKVTFLCVSFFFSRVRMWKRKHQNYTQTELNREQIAQCAGELILNLKVASSNPEVAKSTVLSFLDSWVCKTTGFQSQCWWFKSRVGLRCILKSNARRKKKKIHEQGDMHQVSANCFYCVGKFTLNPRVGWFNLVMIESSWIMQGQLQTWEGLRASVTQTTFNVFIVKT